MVNWGNSDAAVGVVALPVLYTGCAMPASDGGTGAGTTTAAGVIAAPATSGGGNGGVNLGKNVAAAGEVALPL